MMTPELWRRIESLVEDALKLAANARADFLDQACDGDPELRRRVEALLASFDRVDSFMERPVTGGLDPATMDEPTVTFPASAGRRPGEPAGRAHVGPYQILHVIGRGGMGAVYAAARDDHQFERRVAIKLIAPGMHSGSVLQRFRSERQILANLDHPNIARLIDGGTADDGRPYFVMELIEGTRIDGYCDRLRLNVRQRLELFREVCSAVDFAHRNLVVHRDIKPSNILVTDSGMPKLLDFGIAKLLDPSDLPYTVEATRTGLRPMTPPYASPEQILGRPITTASDVYSLGILLYKLLTGRLPYSMDGLSPETMQREAFNNRVARPSLMITQIDDTGELSPEAVSQRRGTQPQQLRRQLAGDLDNIILMALRQEPERRYGSVEQLSEDLRRHLNGLPVSARRDTFGYRAGKFLRRNKIAASIAGTSAALVLGFAVTTARQATQLARQRDRARKERDNADKERNKAETVSAFLTGLFDLADPEKAHGSSIAAREILERGVERIDRELVGQPGVQASLRNAIGRIYRKLGIFEQAAPVLEQALAQRQSILGEQHADVGDTLNELGLVYRYQGHYDQADELYRRALDIRAKHLGMHHPGVAEVMLNLADNHFWSGNGDAARPWIEDGLKILEQTEDVSGALQAKALGTRSLACIEKGELDRAEAIQRQGLELLEQDLEPNRFEVAVATNNLGVVYASTGEYRRAESIYTKALHMFERVVGAEHSETAACMTNIGVCLSVRGEYERAESFLQKALTVMEGTVGPNHRNVASTLSKLAILCRRKGDIDRADLLFNRALDIFSESVSEDNISVAFNLYQLAHLYRDLAQFQHAEKLYLRAIRIHERVFGSSHIDLSESLSGLAGLCAKLGRYDDAKQLYDRALAVALRVSSKYPRDPRPQAQLAVVHLGLGDRLSNLAQLDQAKQAWDRSLAIIEVVTSESDVVEYLDTHCGALLRLGRIDEAKPIVEQLSAIGWRAPDFLDACRPHGLLP